jgi:hypothetical protein
MYDNREAMGEFTQLNPVDPLKLAHVLPLIHKSLLA